jgi:AcrR family transcriptional regulator
MEPRAATRRKPRHDKRRERNRRQLIDATLELVAQEGRAALSISRISRAAGIEPPNFYAHFKSVDECERAAAEELQQYLSRKFEPYRKVRTSPSLDLDKAARANAALLGSWLEEPRWCKLMLRARHDERSPIGAQMRTILEHVRRDALHVLTELTKDMEVQNEVGENLEPLAELCVGHFMTAFEALADGRFTDIEAAGRTVARASQAVVVAELKRAFKVKQERESSLKSQTRTRAVGK